jgi:hypothetical protein
MARTDIDKSVMDDARRMLESAARHLRTAATFPDDRDRRLNEAIANIHAALARLE